MSFYFCRSLLTEDQVKEVEKRGVKVWGFGSISIWKYEQRMTNREKQKSNTLKSMLCLDHRTENKMYEKNMRNLMNCVKKQLEMFYPGNGIYLWSHLALKLLPFVSKVERTDKSSKDNIKKLDKKDMLFELMKTSLQARSFISEVFGSKVATVMDSKRIRKVFLEFKDTQTCSTESVPQLMKSCKKQNAFAGIIIQTKCEVKSTLAICNEVAQHQNLILCNWKKWFGIMFMPKILNGRPEAFSFIQMFNSLAFFETFDIRRLTNLTSTIKSKKRKHVPDLIQVKSIIIKKSKNMNSSKDLKTVIQILENLENGETISATCAESLLVDSPSEAINHLVAEILKYTGSYVES